jgi:hypothetical protein
LMEVPMWTSGNQVYQSNSKEKRLPDDLMEFLYHGE